MKKHNIAVITNESFEDYQKRKGIKPANAPLNTPAPISEPETEQPYEQPKLFGNQETEHCMQNPKTLYEVIQEKQGKKIVLPEKEKMPEPNKSNKEGAYIAPTLSNTIKKG